MRKLPCIAIDGPVAAGKSTIARLVASKLGYTYIDSGAMYRALGWAAREEGILAKDAERVLALLSQIRIRLAPRAGGANQVWVNDREVTGEIRSQDIGELASQLSEIPEVRERMVSLQRLMAGAGGVVMEGRDIQTVVLPDAEVKVFLTAPAEERATRRHLELDQSRHTTSYDAILAEIQGRDERDRNRSHSPLKAAADAVHIDTGGLTAEQVVEKVLGVVRSRMGEGLRPLEPEN